MQGRPLGSFRQFAQTNQFDAGAEYLHRQFDFLQRRESRCKANISVARIFTHVKCRAGGGLV
jgi:hypothetical protein